MALKVTKESKKNDILLNNYKPVKRQKKDQESER